MKTEPDTMRFRLCSLLKCLGVRGKLRFLRTGMFFQNIPVFRSAYFPIPHRLTFGAPVFRSAYSASRNARASAAFAASIKPYYGLCSKTLDLQPLRGLRWAGGASLPPAPPSPAAGAPDVSLNKEGMFPDDRLPQRLLLRRPRSHAEGAFPHGESALTPRPCRSCPRRGPR